MAQMQRHLYSGYAAVAGSQVRFRDLDQSLVSGHRSVASNAVIGILLNDWQATHY